MMIKAVYKNAWPYQKDKMNLPVHALDEAIPFYETRFGFQLQSKVNSPIKSAVLTRDEIQIGLSENGGDPTQDGCFFEVDNVTTAAAELEDNGYPKINDFQIQKHGETSWKVFFVVAPDGLCYSIGEKSK